MKIYNTIDIKNMFPIFKNNKKLIYLDSAATSHMPKTVINTIKNYYTTTHSNVHKGIHTLSEKATELLENTRKKVQKFINAKFLNECIFVKNTTEAINLLATCLSKTYLNKNDIIIITIMEHHANIIPWRFVVNTNKCILKVITLNKNGTLDIEKFKLLLNNKVKIISLTHISNVLGVLNPIEKIIKIAKTYNQNIITIIDGAQSIQHLHIDVQKINCDFFAFSGHKMYGPTGVGILYGKKDLLEQLPPYHGGGNMVLDINKNKVIFNDIPNKFEAGTPAIASIVALNKAVQFLEEIKKKNINHEKVLFNYLIQKLQTIKNINILGTTINKISLISFTHKFLHAHDIGTLLNKHNIAVRTGHLCAIPLLKFLNLTAVTRISLGIYNTYEDVQILYETLLLIEKLFKNK